MTYHPYGIQSLALLLLSIFFTSASSPALASEPDYVRDLPGPASMTLRSLGLKDDALREAAVMRGRMILVDTRDQAACRSVKAALEESGSLPLQNSDLCAPVPGKPLTSVLLFEEMDSVVFRRELDLRFLKSTDHTLVNETRNMALTMGAAMGILWLLPESVTKWDKGEIQGKGFLTKYKENIGSRPVVDKDDPAINFIGHPLSGAAYYTMARHTGLTAMESFGYSVFMSTFFWEYGFEALAERPSIQDLIITPVIGSLLGELFYQAEQKIRADGGELLGSRRLGSVAMVVLNPMGSISGGINKMIGSKFIQSAEVHVVVRRRKNPLTEMESSYVGLELKFGFW